MGTILLSLCFCGIAAGNVINIFFINDVLLYPFASHLLLIRMAPLHGDVLRLSSSSGYDGAIWSLVWIETHWRAKDWEDPSHLHWTTWAGRRGLDIRLHRHYQLKLFFNLCMIECQALKNNKLFSTFSFANHFFHRASWTTLNSPGAQLPSLSVCLMGLCCLVMASLVPSYYLSWFA